MNPIQLQRLVRDAETAHAQREARAAERSQATDPELAGMLRRGVREVLAEVPADRRFTAKQLLKEVREVVAREFTIEQLGEALLWNRGQGYVDVRWNEDYEREEYALTNRGRAIDAA